MTKRTSLLIDLLVIAIGVTGMSFSQPAPPTFVPDTIFVTNVVVELHTTVHEVRGARLEGTFLPARTNVLFDSRSNLYEVHIRSR